jgi:hypothetical protein
MEANAACRPDRVKVLPTCSGNCRRRRRPRNKRDLDMTCKSHKTMIEGRWLTISVLMLAGLLPTAVHAGIVTLTLQSAGSLNQLVLQNQPGQAGADISAISEPPPGLSAMLGIESLTGTVQFVPESSGLMPAGVGGIGLLVCLCRRAKRPRRTLVVR